MCDTCEIASQRQTAQRFALLLLYLFHSYRLHMDELDGIPDPEERHRRLVELNVIEQCINLFKTGKVQRRRVKTYMEGRTYATPRIHACVFDPRTGDLRRLQVRMTTVELVCYRGSTDSFLSFCQRLTSRSTSKSCTTSTICTRFRTTFAPSPMHRSVFMQMASETSVTLSPLGLHRQCCNVQL